MAETLDLTPDVVNVVYYRGDGVPIEVTVTDMTIATPGPLDMTDPARTFVAQIKRSREPGAEVIVDLDVDDSDADSGVLVVSVPADVIEDLPDEGVWDLQWLLAGSDLPRTIVTGDWRTTGDVSGG